MDVIQLTGDCPHCGKILSIVLDHPSHPAFYMCTTNTATWKNRSICRYCGKSVFVDIRIKIKKR